MGAVEMTADEDPQPGAAAAVPLLVDLKDEPTEGDGIVPGDHALFLVAEDLLEVVTTDGDEGRGGVRRRVTEGGVVVGIKRSRR
jgi:hypothetical protein